MSSIDITSHRHEQTTRDVRCGLDCSGEVVAAECPDADEIELSIHGIECVACVDVESGRSGTERRDISECRGIGGPGGTFRETW